MINLQRNISTVFIISILALLLSSCSTVDRVKTALTDASQVDYQNNQSIKQLEIPPDLTKPEFDKAFELPKGVISAVSLKNGGSGAIQESSSVNSNAGAVRTGDLSSVRTIAGRAVLQVNDTYPRAKILTEIMLSRIGFRTIGKSTSGDVITAKYTGADVSAGEAQSSSFMSNFKNIITFGSERRKLKSDKALINGKDYRVNIITIQNSPIVNFTRVDGVNISNAAHAKIISILNNAFNR